MRIKKNHCVNKLLTKNHPDLEFIPYEDAGECQRLFYDLWPNLLRCGIDKYVMSKNFFESFRKAQVSLMDAVLHEKISFSEPVACAFVYKEMVLITYITPLPNGEFDSFVMKVSNQVENPIVEDIGFVYHRNSEDGLTYSYVGYSHWIKGIHGLTGQELFEGQYQFFLSQIILPLFVKYSDVNTRTLPPKSKIKVFNCRYSNLSKERFTVLDSTWLTTLVKSDGFNVRGHFRLQPCGEGMKDRKLIWIDEFQKSGYTRKAGLLKQQRDM